MNLKSTIILFHLFFLFGCSREDSLEPNNTLIWNFDSLDEWEDASQNTNGIINYTIEDNNLRFFTEANTYQRPKVKTIAKFDKGTYTWKVYVPSIGIGDQTSIGAFLYHDDNHELDFEIGYGTTEKRNELGAQENELIVYMTSQNFPYNSFQTKIQKEKWYNLTIDLSQEANGDYLASWKIDGVNQISLPLNYNSSYNFSIFCSLENLQFMGDHIPFTSNYTIFDYVRFEN